MIAAAETIRRTHPCAAHIELYAESAERLTSIKDHSADAVLCAGAFEHMPDKPAVLGELGYWRFVAKGDMPRWAARALEWLDRAGMVCKPSLLRGGLYVCAESP